MRRSNLFAWQLRLLSFALALLTLALATAQDAPRAPAVEPSHAVMLPMRDDTRLSTKVYLPEGDGPWPAILTRTPYNQAPYARRAARYTEAGYAFVSQDFRGRFESDGVYEPYQTEMEDGYDTIEWIATQSWCNGKVGMSGRSAMGIATNLAAAADPPHLVCGYIVTAPESLFDESYFMGGVFREHFRGNFMRLTGAEDQIPAMKARAVLDEQWKRTDFVFHRHNVNVPLYNVGGWYDMFAKGAINNFVQLQYHGRDNARGKQKLLMETWGHSPIDGDLEYVGEGGIDAGFADEMRWFDHWLKDVDTGIMNEPAMTYYHMGAARKGAISPRNRLIRTNTWPPAARDTRFYLHADGLLSTNRPTALGSTTTYRFDPADPVPTVGGANYNNLPDQFPITVGPVDQREIKDRNDYLRFQTEPLTEDVTVQGHIDFELWAATDGPDTDFMVKLIDVYPDGYEALLLDTPIRTRFRNGRAPADIRMMTPGRPELIIIDLWNISQTFEKGHRIAIHITSSNFPRFEVNPNTGEAAGQSAIPPRIATNSIYHDHDHPTAVVLPITELPQE